jgi:hypothetical protein
MPTEPMVTKKNCAHITCNNNRARLTHTFSFTGQGYSGMSTFASE